MIKRLLFLICLITLFLPAIAQVDSLPIKTTIKDGMILFTIPPSYHKPENLPMAKPRYVHSIRTLVVKEYNPSRRDMIQTLEHRLSAGLSESNEGLSYMELVCLYIYIGNNKTAHLPSRAREIISLWANNKSYKFNEEAKLVADYINFADEMTVKFGYK